MAIARLLKDDSRITASIAQVEAKIFSGAVKHKSKTEQQVLAESYKSQIDQLVDTMWHLSTFLFRKIDISKVKTYKENEPVPAAYQRYINVMRNLPEYIVAEILSQSSYAKALFVLERWVRVMKDCFERNDFFSASAIVSGLSFYQLTNTGLSNDMGDLPQGVLNYHQYLFARSKKLYNLQQAKSQTHPVIPVLTTLTSMLEGVNGGIMAAGHQSGVASTLESIFLKRRISSSIQLMQDKLQVPRDESVGYAVNSLAFAQELPVPKIKTFKFGFEVKEKNKLVTGMTAMIELFSKEDELYTRRFAVLSKPSLRQLQHRESVYDRPFFDKKSLKRVRQHVRQPAYTAKKI